MSMVEVHVTARVAMVLNRVKSTVFFFVGWTFPIMASFIIGCSDNFGQLGGGHFIC